jgi:3-methyladenine DNA glycosylase/8-oxoguanine DNA glycosylase
MTQFQLPARQPFSFYSAVRSHGWVQLAPFVWDEETQVLGYILRLGSGKVIALRLSEAPGGVRLQASADLSSVEQDELASTITWMLALDQDFSAFYSLASQEPKLQTMVTQARGRVLRSPTLFEDVVRTILTTNTLWAATRRMCLNLVEQFGQPPDGDVEADFAPVLHPLRRAFPTPERLAATDEAALRGQTRLGYRAPYVLALAQHITSGALDLEALKHSDLPTPELRKRLLAIKGIGGYAVAVLLMILGRYDAIPVDSWALKSVSNEWYDGQPVGKAEVEAAFERWGEWRGLAYWFWDWSEERCQPTNSHSVYLPRGCDQPADQAE